MRKCDCSQKNEKYLNSKKDFIKLSGPFNKKLWAILVFLNVVNFSEPTHQQPVRTSIHFLKSGSSESPTPASAGASCRINDEFSLFLPGKSTRFFKLMIKFLHKYSYGT